MDSLTRVVCAGVVLSGREPRPVSLGLWRAGAFANGAAVRRRRPRGFGWVSLAWRPGLPAWCGASLRPRWLVFQPFSRWVSSHDTAWWPRPLGEAGRRPSFEMGPDRRPGWQAPAACHRTPTFLPWLHRPLCACLQTDVAVLLPDVLWWFSGGIPRLTFPYFSLRIASSDARPGPWTGSQLCGCRRSPGAFV